MKYRQPSVSPSTATSTVLRQSARCIPPASARCAQVARAARARTHAQALSVAPMPTNGAPNMTLIAASVGETASFSAR